MVLSFLLMSRIFRRTFSFRLGMVPFGRTRVWYSRNSRRVPKFIRLLRKRMVPIPMRQRTVTLRLPSSRRVRHGRRCSLRTRLRPRRGSWLILTLRRFTLILRMVEPFSRMRVVVFRMVVMVSPTLERASRLARRLGRRVTLWRLLMVRISPLFSMLSRMMVRMFILMAQFSRRWVPCSRWRAYCSRLVVLVSRVVVPLVLIRAFSRMVRRIAPLVVGRRRVLFW